MWRDLMRPTQAAGGGSGQKAVTDHVHCLGFISTMAQLQHSIINNIITGGGGHKKIGMLSLGIVTLNVVVVL